MERIKTDSMKLRGRSEVELLQIYNGLDSAITYKIWQKLLPKLDPETTAIVYRNERDFQAPALEMMLRGIRIDSFAWSEFLDKCKHRINRLEWILDQYAFAVWGQPLNPNSPKQLADFFYKVMRIPPVTKWDPKTKTQKQTTDREALEKIGKRFYAKPIAACIIKLKETKKLLSTLYKCIDHDSRLRASFNVAGTETGRWSSSGNAFGTGTNLQNQTEELRHLYSADAKFRMAYTDLEQAESRAVGLLCFLAFGATAYLDACEAGDLHTTVCKMVWPELPWTGDLAYDKKHVAGQPFYRHFSYRDMAKRGGHGTNYYGKPVTMAMHLKLETRVVEEFQDRYFSAFPEIALWHQRVAEVLQTEGVLTTPLGRRRKFFGRLDSDNTLREAIAYQPQSMVGDILNMGLLSVWRELPYVQLLAQVHDAILYQYPEESEATVIPHVERLLTRKYTFNSRPFSIPVETCVGWNWAYRKENKETGEITNPDGLVKYAGNDERTRQADPTLSMLYRRF
jgi:DNA polymerase I-like protein with 3'-5' exonuclease and polymerase domains